ncbi:MAG TPA: penicillin acylase family protein [Chloroflexia bacterium]|nr:penicillin acylase family protein [Chloroflexia bacterium]
MKQIDRTTSGSVKSRPSRSRRVLKYSLFTLGGLVLLVLLLTAFLLFWLVLRPLPQTGGTLQVAGLTAEVKVVRDKAGVPHITASNAHDLFMAQGYVTAQDRLWQMDFNRRVGAGRLSEVLGEAALSQDRFLRTIGLRRAAAAEESDMTPDERQILENYAAGVNAFIDTHQDNLPLEFSLLGFKPEHWTPLDSITWGKVMAYDLSDNYGKEILRASLVDKLGADKAAALLPTSPAGNTPLIVPQGVSYKGMDQNLALVTLQEQTAVLAGTDFASRGSNNWVVAGAKTTTGKPMLANDPHLGIRNPSVWYEVELSGAGWHVAGVTFPGVPAVVIGHNDRIAWGVTNVGGDTQDFYMEKTNPANPNQYEFKGQWENMQVVPEEIKIKGKPSETVNVRITRHGPIMNDVLDSIKDEQPMALQWTALKKSPLLGSVLKYNQATNWQQFRDALRGFNVPAQNFVYADVDGNIGYQVPGMWPVRAKGNGLLPVPGWTGEYEWTGYVPFENLPSVYNPPAGFVATANNRPVPNTPQLYLGDEFDPGWRAARITQLIQSKEKLSLQDLANIQNDVYTIPGKEIATYLGNLPANDSKIADAVKRLKAWDGRLTADSVPGALYKVTYQYMLENMFKGKLGDVFTSYEDYQAFHLPFILSLLKDPQNEWWGSGGRDALLQKSLGQAVDYLSGKFGGNADDWKWGKLHNLTFTETPIGDAVPAPLKPIMNLKTVEKAGDGTTVAASSYKYSVSYVQTSGQSFRGLMNLANFDDSLITNTIGQSGQPFSKHYGDNIDDWNGAGYHPFVFSDNAVEKQKDEVLTLQPK